MTDPDAAVTLTPERCFRALKHYSPEAVRNIRLALDVGSTPAELKKLYCGQFADRIHAAIDYMAANPEAGVVVWDGMNYDWRDKS